MELEDQVCTWEQAKRLKEFGVDFFQTIWAYDSDGDLYLKEYPTLFKDEYNAYTVAELGILLEISADCSHDLVLKTDMAIKDSIRIERHIPDGTYRLKVVINAETEAQARAEALIWLIENGYIKPLELTL